MSAAISAGGVAVERDHGDAEVDVVGAARRTRPASRGPWRRGGRWTRSRRSRARAQRAASGRATSGSRPAATPKPRLTSRSEQRDALDVRGLREHVDRLHPAQPIAGLGELGGVRGERRRVAGDVDDPLRLALDHPADDLLREAGARRVDDDDVGLARPPRAAAGCRCGRRPARKWAFSIPLRSALRSASATASATISSPQTSPALARPASGRSCRSRSRGRRRARSRRGRRTRAAIA